MGGFVSIDGHETKQSCAKPCIHFHDTTIQIESGSARHGRASLLTTRATETAQSIKAKTAIPQIPRRRAVAAFKSFSGVLESRVIP